ncbi:Protein of unknown function [Thermobacillus xylanilyticus]|uniref:Uncharacterized protein n=1 Tax=Thermobacillus xylanilyticus TaxID=76633 RepID=A0ABN7RL36_THEXY|nr:Protein of unknown function [Thermobacillus xylanilyticus]
MTEQPPAAARRKAGAESCGSVRRSRRHRSNSPGSGRIDTGAERTAARG